MPTYNVQADLTTGDLHVVGKNGRRYSLDELEAAEASARRGDRAAQELLCQVDLSRDDDGRALVEHDAVAAAQRALQDCAECRAPP